MSDSLCGPSTGTKNLLKAVGRDRQNEQDRFVSAFSGSPASSSFRTHTGSGAQADAAFQSFQSGHQGLVGPAVSPMDQLARSGPPLGSNPGSGFHQAFTGMDQAPQMGPALAPVASAPSNWVDQFSGLNVNGGPLHRGAPAHFAGASSHYAGVPAPQDAFSAYNLFSSPFAGHASRPSPFPAFSTAFPGNHVHESQPMGPQEAEALKAREERFLAAYRAFEEANIEETDQNHQFAQAESGQQPDSVQTHVDLAEVEREIEANEQETSQPHDRQRQDDDLVRAASSILGTVAGVEDPKFKNSTFLETMRKIASYQVVLDNNDLIDTQTGESVFSRSPGVAENPVGTKQSSVGEAEGKGKERLDAYQ